MKPRYSLPSMATLGGLLIALNPALAQTWTLTTAPITNWSSVASSADGAKLVASVGYDFSRQIVGGGPIYTSTNSGATWTATSAPVTNWSSVACSADGARLVAMGGSGIYNSTNSGTTWMQSTNAPDTYAVASSADGARLVAVGGSGMYTSTDSGATWRQLTNAPAADVVASSADGTVLLGAIHIGPVNLSTNSGATWWTQQALGTTTNWAVGCSADGRTLVAMGDGPGFFDIHTSTNSGARWTSAGGGSGWISSLAASADGAKLVMAAGHDYEYRFFVVGPIYTSTNAGSTWMSNSAPVANWSSVASSADGNKLVAVVSGGGIWVSQANPAPVLTFASTGGELLLSWTQPSADFVLQENSDLTTTNWTDVPAIPKLNLTNLQNQVILSPSPGNRFYRLKH